jgi:hypothetical protein
MTARVGTRSSSSTCTARADARNPSGALPRDPARGCRPHMKDSTWNIKVRQLQAYRDHIVRNMFVCTPRIASFHAVTQFECLDRNTALRCCHESFGNNAARRQGSSTRSAPKAQWGMRAPTTRSPPLLLCDLRAVLRNSPHMTRSRQDISYQPRALMVICSTGPQV